LNARAPPCGGARIHPRGRRQPQPTFEKGISFVSRTTSPAPSGRKRHDRDVAPLAMLIAANLAGAHNTGQYLASIAALAVALAHDTLVRRRQARDS
jgi:hypothetical protein